MILFGPFLALFFASIAKNKQGHGISVVYKFALAMFILSAGFLVYVVAGIRGSVYGHVSMLYVVAAYMIFPIAELCIMPIGLSLVTRYAPRSLEALMVGVFMLASAGASYLTGIISRVAQINFSYAKLAGLQHAARVYTHLFIITATVLAAVGVVLIVIKPLLNRLTLEPN